MSNLTEILLWVVLAALGGGAATWWMTRRKRDLRQEDIDPSTGYRTDLAETDRALRHQLEDVAATAAEPEPDDRSQAIADLANHRRSREP